MTEEKLPFAARLFQEAVQQNWKQFTNPDSLCALLYLGLGMHLARDFYSPMMFKTAEEKVPKDLVASLNPGLKRIFEDSRAVSGTLMRFGKVGTCPMSGLVELFYADRVVGNEVLPFISAHSSPILGYAGGFGVLGFGGLGGRSKQYLEPFWNSFSSPKNLADAYLKRIVRDLKLGR
ncbi:hypothetical protein HYU17_01260 [Candidatus Woesearchaeota archaeon]|nr:hypothetical protein [Candidatus Woesearchaeota archaeon]